MRRALFIGLLALVPALACGGQAEALPTVFVLSPAATQPEPPQVELTTPVPTNTPPSPVEVGTSRSNPVPVGSGVTVSDVVLVVGETIRPADELIATAEDFFYVPPEQSNEYVMVWVAVACNATDDTTCIVTPLFDFGLVGSSGIVRQTEFLLTQVPDLFQGGEVYGGVTLEGWLPFQVAQGETGLVLVYKTLQLFGPSEVFLAVQ